MNKTKTTFSDHLIDDETTLVLPKRLRSSAFPKLIVFINENNVLKLVLSSVNPKHIKHVANLVKHCPRAFMVRD